MSSRAFVDGRWWQDGTPFSFLVENGRIVAHGVDPSFADEIVDLGGAWVMPGFIDCHMHVLPAGLQALQLDLSDASSREEVLLRIRERAADLAPTEWILAVQYDANRFDDGVDVNADELEAASDGRRTILRHASGHACVASRSALLEAGIRSDTEDPRGGTIVRDQSGEPTGLLLENAMELVYRKAPDVPPDQWPKAIDAVSARLLSRGITCASDMMTGQRGLAAELAGYRNSRSKLRIRFFVQWNRMFGKHAEPEVRLPNDERLRVVGIKLFADGAIGSGTAAIYGSYTTGGEGNLIYPPEEVKRRVLAADAAGYHIAIHSIGDRSTDVVLDAYEACADPSKHRLEHVMLLSDEQIQRIRRNSIRVTMQPEFLRVFGAAYRRRLGPDRAMNLKRIRSLHEVGVIVGLSSDNPIVPGDPWTGIRAAAMRPDGFHPAEAISLREAVSLYTHGAAAANFEESEMGALAPGQLADFQLYGSDPIEGEGKLIATFVGGEQAWPNSES